MPLDLLESLAALEHDQWIEWSKTLAAKENLTHGRLGRWGKLWKPYSELTEEEKEQDRTWARKVLAVIDAERKKQAEERRRLADKLKAEKTRDTEEIEGEGWYPISAITLNEVIAELTQSRPEE